MKKSLSATFLFALVGLALVLSLLSLSALTANAETVTRSLGSTLTESSSGYSSSADHIVSTMKNSKQNLTAITISGDIITESTKDNIPAYGLNGSQASFSISYDNSLLDDSNPDVWHIVSDKGTSVDGYSLGASIGKGCLLIFKKHRGGEYELATNPITNFTYGVDNFYTPSGEDVYEGTYYKIVFAYSSRIRTQSGFIGIGVKYDTYYHMETYEFYLCEDSANVSIHNLALTEEDFDYEDYDINLLKKGETLVNESVTTAGFQIDKLNISGNTILVKYNGVSIPNVADGTKFTEPGKYEITVVTRLGTQRKQDIYIFNSEDKGYSTYFGSNLIHGNRVFRFGDYPSYAKGASIEINQVDENTPILHGTVTNLDTGEIVFETNKTREAQRFDLAPANYQIDFYSGDYNIAGSLYRYTFKFEILDEKSAPYINYYTLMHSERLADLQSKHYEVAYQTTKGGYIFVCFSLDSYDEAFEYAYEIEKRFIEHKEDGLYYKSLENPSKKVKYIDYIELTAALNYYAKLNVEISYFNTTDEFTYQTYNNDLLDSLESLNISDSIRVFPSQEEKDKLIKHKPYINGFEFINVADYDVVEVTAYCEKDGKTYNIQFNKPIEEQLHISSKYTITETNIYGDSVSYDVYFVNENQTISHWIATTNGVESIVDISSRDVNNGKIKITADSLVLQDITNMLDENAIVAIKAPGLYAFEITCLVSEMDGFTLYEAGTYELMFVDMTGHYYQFIVTINGRQWNDVLAQNTTSYTALYNAVYLNAKADHSTEVAYDASAFSKIMTDISAIPYMVYTSESIQPLVDKYNQALAVAGNNPTQKEIDALTDALTSLKSKLVLRENKQQLLDALTTLSNMELGEVSSKKAADYQKAYDDATAVLYNIDATDAEISSAINSILSIQDEILNPSTFWLWYVIVGVTACAVCGVTLFVLIRRRKNHEAST